MLQLILQLTCLLIIFKSFTRTLMDYGDVFYDLPSMINSQKILNQSNIALAITRAIKVPLPKHCINNKDLNIFIREDG